jgi:hypothetical protein
MNGGHDAENSAFREAAAIGWDATVTAMKYEDGKIVEIVVMVNPYRVTPTGNVCPSCAQGLCEICTGDISPCDCPNHERNKE